MPNGLFEGLFLLAFFLPPIAVVCGVLLLIVPAPSVRPVKLPTPPVPQAH
jgi:hypothetical protein